MKRLNHLPSLSSLTQEQKKYVLQFDNGLLRRVADATRKSHVSVHLVYWGKTKYSPDIEAHLSIEAAKVLKRIHKERPLAARQLKLCA